MGIYPWQSDIWRNFMSMRQRMPHALLLHGRAGTGKVEFAHAFAQALLCDTPTVDGFACGTCPSCGWFVQGNHPDFRLLEPEEAPEGGADTGAGEDSRAEPVKEAKSRKKSQIAVHQVRALGDFFGLSTHRQGYRIVLLHPAESLNPASANALLKMLEEPPPATLFLLVSHQPQRLLPTIRSRCSKMTMTLPDRNTAGNWLASQGVQDFPRQLAYAGGAPLTVTTSNGELDARRQALFGFLGQGRKLDPLAAAAACAKDGMLEVVVALQKWAYDLLALKLTGQIRYHAHLAVPMQELSKSVDLSSLLSFQRLLDEARRLAQHSLNVELQLEDLLIRYVRLFRPQSIS
jgi:DNA polymerase-3 subunit delta'